MEENMATPNHYAPCPNCGNINASKAEYTWWGGVIGPYLLSHVTCNYCGTGYNSKTGKANDAAIRKYIWMSLLVGLLIIGLCVALSMGMRLMYCPNLISR